MYFLWKILEYLHYFPLLIFSLLFLLNYPDINNFNLVQSITFFKEVRLAYWVTTAISISSLIFWFFFINEAGLEKVAHKYAPNSHAVAAGLNIAGFNSAIALGSILGGMTISHIGLSFTGITGAVLSVIGLLILVIQIQNSASQKA